MIGGDLAWFVKYNVAIGEATMVNTDSSFGYRKLPNHDAVKTLCQQIYPWRCAYQWH